MVSVHQNWEAYTNAERIVVPELDFETESVIFVYFHQKFHEFPRTTDFKAIDL